MAPRPIPRPMFLPFEPSRSSHSDCSSLLDRPIGLSCRTGRETIPADLRWPPPRPPLLASVAGLWTGVGPTMGRATVRPTPRHMHTHMHM
eukprot:3163642-Prymnesium_polylepis.1